MLGRMSRRLLVGVTAVGLVLSAACSSSSSSGDSTTGAATAAATSTVAAGSSQESAPASASGSASDAPSAGQSSGGQSAAPAQIVVPDEIKSKGAIDVSAFFNYPPYTVVNNGKLEGIEPTLVRAVAAKMGVEARFTTWPSRR